MQLRSIATYLVFSLFVGHALSAQAQESAGSAREHYQRGTKAYDLGHYDEAVTEYETAYKLKDDPALLYNLAQAHRLAGHHAEAVRVYKAFLRNLPRAKNRVEIEGRIETEQRLADEEAAAKKVEPPPPPPSPVVAPVAEPVAVVAPQADPRRGRRLRIAGIALLGVGGAGLLLGAAFVGLANKANGDINPTGGTFDAAAEDQRNRYQGLDAAFFTVGAVAAATGLTLYLVGRHEAHRIVSARADGPVTSEGGR
jgi:tetratricopeptide (TPR) repeat protein